MAETQNDRIENMLKILVGAITTVDMKGTDSEKKELRNTVSNYTSKKEGL